MRPPILETLVGRRVAQRGTSLLEIVITVAIMTIGMLGYFTLHMRSFATSANAAAMTQAAAYAAAVQDSLLAIPFVRGQSLATQASCAPITVDELATLCRELEVLGSNGEVLTAAGPEAKGFHRSYHVEYLSEDLMRLTVRVRYPSDSGRCPSCGSFQSGWKAVTMSTLRAATAY